MILHGNNHARFMPNLRLLNIECMDQTSEETWEKISAFADGHAATSSAIADKSNHIDVLTIQGAPEHWRDRAIPSVGRVIFKPPGRWSHWGASSGWDTCSIWHDWEDE